MEVEFRKDLRHNYMVIKEEDHLKVEPYCIKMLEQPVEGILPLEQRFMDNRYLHYYEITAKQSMASLLEKMTLSCEKLYQLISKLLSVLETAYEYLLPEDDFILLPDFIYLDIKSFTPSLCFFSGYKKDIKGQLKLLFEFLMNKVDYHDKDAVFLVYQLYAASREENFTVEQLFEVLQKQKTDSVEQSAGKKKAVAEASGEKRLQKDGPEQKDRDGANKHEVSGIRKKDGRVKNNPPEVSVMMERLESETETYYYSWKTYLLTAGSILAGLGILGLGFLTKILYNVYGNRIDYSKLFALILILLCSESYLIKIIWDKKNRLTKFEKKCEYINPMEEENKNKGEKKKGITLGEQIKNTFRQQNQKILPPEDILKTLAEQDAQIRNISDQLPYQRNTFDLPDIREEEEERPTCLLNEQEIKVKIVLKPLDEENFSTIAIFDFPFFVGKLRRNVDYCLEKDVVSRFHAKITKEQDNYFITDLNSTNGTFVNQEGVPTYQKKEIRFGDEIAFADIRYRFLQV